MTIQLRSLLFISNSEIQRHVFEPDCLVFIYLFWASRYTHTHTASASQRNRIFYFLIPLITCSTTKHNWSLVNNNKKTNLKLSMLTLWYFWSKTQKLLRLSKLTYCLCSWLFNVIFFVKSDYSTLELQNCFWRKCRKNEVLLFLEY